MKLKLLEDNPELLPFREEILDRHYRYLGMITYLNEQFGGLREFSSAYKYFGFNYDKKAKGWYYREWAPGAHKIFLFGDFNGWDRTTHPLTSKGNGIWEIFLPDAEYKKSFTHESLYKICVHAANGIKDRIPAYVRRVVQDEVTKDYRAQHWAPAKPYKFKHSFKVPTDFKPLIYEAHVGMAQEKEGVGTYAEFEEKILPYIKACGYNTIQLMAIQEHPYYGSYGYHVSNFFAPSSRFGTPDELKSLIDTAHSMGIAVIMDIVHSHSVKNIYEGINELDGTEHQYFHAGEKGNHPAWDSKCFNYGKIEVKQFLLSNVAYWLDEFNFDGFRFDGVTSMLYFHHGLNFSFTDLNSYYGGRIDPDAFLYLQLANKLIHTIYPTAISVAEDVSGLPGLGRKPEEGGVGFDHRLGMGMPDFWIKIIKEQADEAWNMYDMYHMLTNRRYDENTIAYCESHDQALVGDQTLAFRLIGKEMYDNMSKFTPSLVVDRGIALHKMIRLLTISGGGDGYLNFMGNEFGHPEWIDFPREGNNWSYKYARRQWSLAGTDHLRYHYLADFDKAMLSLITKFDVLSDKFCKEIHIDNINKVIIFERKDLLFLFNFHPVNSIFDYQFHTRVRGKYTIILNSDHEQFGGFNRVDESVVYETFEGNKLRIYLTNRTAMAMQRIATFDK
jgi:1,4-alpha-glucan branching enzyme